MNAEEKEFDQDLRNLKSTFINLCYAGLIFGVIGIGYSLSQIGFNFSPNSYLQSKVEARIGEIETPLIDATARINKFIQDSLLTVYSADLYTTEKFRYDSLILNRLFLDPDFQSIDIGPTGFVYISDSSKNVIFSNQTLYRPDQYKSLKLVGNNQRDGNSLNRFIDSVISDTAIQDIHREVYKDQSVLKNRQWRIYSKIQPFNITPVIIFNQEEIHVDWQKFINILFLYILSSLAILVSLTYLFIYPFSRRFPKLVKMRLANNIWSFTALSSIYLFVGIIHMLFVVDQNLFRIEKERNRSENPEIVEYPGAISYVKDSLQIDISKLGYNHNELSQLGITSRKRVNLDTAVAQLTISKGKKTDERNIHQLTMRISSLSLAEEDYVNVVGQVTVRHAKRILNEEPKTEEPPFYFPDAVDSKIGILDIDKVLIPRKSDMDSTKNWVTVWQFSAKLYQNIRYQLYPFDAKQIKIRVGHTDVDNEFFIPDFDNLYNHAISFYDQSTIQDTLTGSLSESDSVKLSRILQGINHNMQLSEWKITDACYNLGKTDQLSSITSNKKGSVTPEYIQVIDIKRDLLSPLISNYLLLFVISIILFIMVLLSKESEVGHLITTYVGLFFSLLISHFKLREDLQFHSIVYIEYYYFILYFLLMVFIIHKYLIHVKIDSLILTYRNNLLPKILYWPFLLAFILLFSMIYFNMDFSH